MPGKSLVSSVLILVLSVLFCCQEVDQERIQEIMKQKQVYEDQSRRKPDPSGQMLAGKRIRKEKLKGANLRSAMLAGADLRETDLEDADLTGAMLMGANLGGANLVNANFEGAMLLGSQLENAQIDGVNFTNAGFLTQEQLDEACGKPRALPEGLKAPDGANCKPTIVAPK